MRIALVVSRYYPEITDRLEAGAREAMAERSPSAHADSFDAPGAFELVPIANASCESGAFDGVVCLGCVIRGETRHDEYINSAVAHGITAISSRTGVPVSFGLLTVENRAQAEARAGGAKGNKGREAMDALLATIDSIEMVQRIAADRGVACGDNPGGVS